MTHEQASAGEMGWPNRHWSEVFESPPLLLCFPSTFAAAAASCHSLHCAPAFDQPATETHRVCIHSCATGSARLEERGTIAMETSKRCENEQEGRGSHTAVALAVSCRASFRCRAVLSPLLRQELLAPLPAFLCRHIPPRLPPPLPLRQLRQRVESAMIVPWPLPLHPSGVDQLVRPPPPLPPLPLLLLCLSTIWRVCWDGTAVARPIERVTSEPCGTAFWPAIAK